MIDSHKTRVIGTLAGNNLISELKSEKYYGNPKRAYHNVNHINHMIFALDLYYSATTNLTQLEYELLYWAIWYHDAVYNVLSSENEENSVALATYKLRKYFNQDEITILRNLILVTKHIGNDTSNIELKTLSEKFPYNLMSDLDLLILGEQKNNYKAYTHAIRQEYSHIDALTFYPKRKEILLMFLNRPFIYSQTPFFSLFESRARTNIQEEINEILINSFIV